MKMNIQAFFKVHPELKMSILAKRAGMGTGQMYQYSSGFQEPGQRSLQRIVNVIHEIGNDLISVEILSPDYKVIEATNKFEQKVKLLQIEYGLSDDDVMDCLTRLQQQYQKKIQVTNFLNK